MFRNYQMATIRFEQEWIYRAHYVAEHENFSEIKFVFICGDETDANQLISRLQKRRIEIQKVSVVVGYLESKDGELSTFIFTNEIQL